MRTKNNWPIGTLFKLVIILLPFTAFYNVLPWLNPYAQQLTFYPLMLLLSILCIYKARSNITASDIILIRPLVWFALFVMISFVINCESILTNKLMSETGLSKFITHCAQLLFGIVIILVFVNFVDSENKFQSLISYVDITVILLMVYCLFELIAYFGIGSSIFYEVDQLLHQTKTIGGESYAYEIPSRLRLNGYTQEPSHLGIIFSFLFPFFLILNNERTKWLKVLFTLLIMFFTFSRTLYIIAILEIMLFLYLRREVCIDIKSIFMKAVPYMLVVALALYILTPYYSEFFTSGSTVSRASSATAAINGWTDSGKLLFGEGFGQHGFYTYEYYKIMSDFNHEFRAVGEGSRWPFIQNIHVKVMIELGISGLVLWLYIYFYMLKRINVILRNKYLIYCIKDSYGQATLISIIGILIAGVSYENFSYLWTWIAFGIAFAYININKNYLNEFQLLNSNKLNIRIS